MVVHNSITGFSELTEHISEVKYYLSLLVKTAIIFEPAHNWIFEYYHFNRDSEPIIDRSYKFSLGQHNNYFYIKKFDNGQIKGRYEEKRTPKTTMLKEQENIIQENIQEPFKFVYRRASELLKDQSDKLVT